MTAKQRSDWTSFCRVLGRMGRLLQRRRTPEGSYTPVREQRHPLLDIVIKSPAVIAAIGDVKATDQEQRGVLSWADVRQGDTAATIRINHKGTHENSQRALSAAIDALRRFGKRVSFRDLIRHPNQNGYIALIRVAGGAPSLGFAR